MNSGLARIAKNTVLKKPRRLPMIMISVTLVIIIGLGIGLFFILRSPKPVKDEVETEEQVQQEIPEPIDISPPSLERPVILPGEQQEEQIQEEVLNVSNDYIGKSYRIKFSGNKCMYPDGVWGCWDDPNMVFKIVDATNGKVRVHHSLTGKCIYIEEGSMSMKSWDCWNDPNMEFRIIKSSDDTLKLKHSNTGMCLKPLKIEDGSKLSAVKCDKDVIIDLVEVPAIRVSWRSAAKDANITSNGVMACQAALPSSVADDTGVQSDIGLIQPGSYINGSCNISFGGKAYKGEKPKFLTGSDLSWSNSKPGNQIIGGEDRGGKPLFVCRGEKDGVKYIGKKQDEWDFCNIPVGNAEITSETYEYLGY